MHPAHNREIPSSNLRWGYQNRTEPDMQYKVFWIKIEDMEYNRTYNRKNPQDLFTYKIYYNYTCCESGTRALKSHAEEAAKHWIDTHGYTWLTENI
jgi:hypothetical protein